MVASPEKAFLLKSSLLRTLNVANIETKIRLALESEREAIARCIAEGFERDFSLFSKDTDKVTAALVPGIVPRRFYVAERGQEIVGVAGISDSTERAVYTDARALRINFGFWKGLLAKLVLKLEFEGRLPYPPTTGFIEFVAVRKVYRRRGIASLLLQESMVKAGYQEYALDVMAENVSARNCYEKLGFHAFKSAGKKVFMRLERPHAV